MAVVHAWSSQQAKGAFRNRLIKSGSFIYDGTGSEDAHLNRIVKRGLTLEEAREHCRDPETSSSTCTRSDRKAITKRYGPWFDGYGEV